MSGFFLFSIFPTDQPTDPLRFFVLQVILKIALALSVKISLKKQLSNPTVWIRAIGRGICTLRRSIRIKEPKFQSKQFAPQKSCYSYKYYHNIIYSYANKVRLCKLRNSLGLQRKLYLPPVQKLTLRLIHRHTLTFATLDKKPFQLEPLNKHLQTFTRVCM